MQNQPSRREIPVPVVLQEVNGSAISLSHGLCNSLSLCVATLVLQRRIQTLELDTRISRRETPIDGGCGGITLRLPTGHLVRQCLQGSAFDFGPCSTNFHAEACDGFPVLLPGDAPRRRKGLIESRWGMGR
jgi:hypothetical protein